jgi:hypothetical protein
MSDTKGSLPDPLVRHRLYPEPGQIFAFRPVTLNEALTDGLIVVDTNVLLVPYTTGKASLQQIHQTFQRLTNESRLRVPGQVAREFAANRAEKLKELFQQISRKRNVGITISQYPLLDGVSGYAKLKELEAAAIGALESYRKAISELLDTIAGWQWNDPVSQIYRELLTPDIVIEPEIERDELLKELKYRQDNRVPPGYKDAAGDYSGIGDLLIWETILSIGRRESRHVIFVSGDEKTDWRYQSENEALYPRFELLEEYRIASRSKSLLIISFAELLQQFGAPAPVVAEVRQEEAAAALRTSGLTSIDSSINVDEPVTPQSISAFLAERYPDRRNARWSSEYVELSRELRSMQIKTLRQLDRMLTDVAPVFPLSENEDAPTSPDGKYSDVGIVRRSLAIANDGYRLWRFGSENPEKYQRWRRLLQQGSSELATE